MKKAGLRKAAVRLATTSVALLILPAWIAIGFGVGAHDPGAVFVYLVQLLALLGGVIALVLFILSLFRESA